MRIVWVYLAGLFRELSIVIPFVLIIDHLAKFYCQHRPSSPIYRQDMQKLSDDVEFYSTTAKKAFAEFSKWVDHSGYLKPGEKLFSSPTARDMCVGIVTMKRRGEKAQERGYLTTLMMSLVTRIPWKFSNRISIRMFAMDKDKDEANFNPEAIALSKYFEMSRPQPVDPIYQPESFRTPKEQVLFQEAVDYLSVLRAMPADCTYSLILEDDAMASYNWFEKIERAMKQIPKDEDWSILKIFYSNRTYVSSKLVIKKRYYGYTALGLAFIASTILSKFVYIKKNSSFKKSYMMFPFRRSTIISTFILFVSFLRIFLHFGRISFGFLQYPYVEKNSVQCLMQAIVYPHPKLTLLANFFAEKLSVPQSEYIPKDFYDYIFYKKTSAITYLAVPSIFEHIGIDSSLQDSRWATEMLFPMGIGFEDYRKPILFDPKVVFASK